MAMCERMDTHHASVGADPRQPSPQGDEVTGLSARWSRSGHNFTWLALCRHINASLQDVLAPFGRPGGQPIGVRPYGNIDGMGGWERLP